jgi:hypothetical protein
MKQLQMFIDYAMLGYDVSFTSIVGHEGIRMIKRYSHPAERSLVSEQIFAYDEAKNEERLHSVLQFMYEDIQQQEETKDYRQTTAEWLQS